MSEEPSIRAYLCDECWNSIPHMKVVMPKVSKGPTHNLPHILRDISFINNSFDAAPEV